MILKEFYLQKKVHIAALINKKTTEDTISVGLFNDLVFQEKANVNSPLVMFKYNHVDWTTSSKN